MCETLDFNLERSIIILVMKNNERETMTKKKYYMILDTETTSNAKMVYDIAYTIIDRQGNIIEQTNYLVKEIIEHPFLKGILQRDKFSSRKYRKTYADLYTDGKIVMPFLHIRQAIRKAIRTYDCPVVAYNAKFDYEALTEMARDLGKQSFFTKNTQVWDLWNIALYILCDSRNYEKFCDANDYHSEKGHRKSSAEIVYRYLTNDLNFEEAHTALADTEIEAAILLACLKRKKKLHTDFVGQVFRHPIWVERCRVNLG